MARAFTLTADGGSRGNPGAAGYGAVVSEDLKIIYLTILKILRIK